MRRWLTSASWFWILPALALILNTAAHAQWGSAAATPPPPANMPQAISTRQSSFAIPYTIPVPKTPAETPAEIRLFASSDQGKSWQLAETTKLGAITETQRGQFTFRAPGDAEYWFAIRTVDRAGQLRGGRNGPELRVIVDTQPPVIKLDAQRGAAGEIAIRYDISDAALQPQSLALSYQLAGMTDWRSISFDKPFGAVPDKPLQGSTTFWPERAGAEMQVRLEILDAAGNNGTSQVAVPLARGVPAQPVARNLNEATTPWPGQSTSPQPSPAQPTSPQAQPSSPPGLPPNFGQQNSALNHPAMAARPGVRHDDPPPAYPFGDTSQPSGTRWNDVTNPTPAHTVSSSPAPTLAPPQYSLGPPTPPPSIAGGPSGPALFGPQDNPPAYPGTVSAGPANAGASNISISPPIPAQPLLAQQQPLASPVAPRVESRVSAPYEPPPVTGLRDYRLPTGEQPRMVNGRTFEWDYELESVGAAGIAKIELWMTRDGGNSWASVGVDPDNRSPVRTMVDGEGLFGYRMTVQSAGGAQPRAPQSGEQPEMWIGVDLTKPYARLLNAELGQGSAQGEIAITWEAKDALLARQPVSLAYSERREGPWTTIAAGLENTGRYAWRYDSQTPERLYLRLEVRDEAGNIGVSESIEPLSLERTNPAVKLRNVRPVQEGNPQSRITPAPSASPVTNNAERSIAALPQPVVNTTINPRANTPAMTQAAAPVSSGPLPIVLPPAASLTSSPSASTTIINNSAASSTNPRTLPSGRTTTPTSPRSTVWSTPTNANPEVMTNPYLQPNTGTIRR